MSVSDDIALQLQQLYTGPTHPYDVTLQDYLDTHPLSAAQTFISLTTVPTTTWDSADTAGVGKTFGIGFFVQVQSTKALYRCSDATPSAAVWNIIIQENI